LLLLGIIFFILIRKKKKTEAVHEILQVDMESIPSKASTDGRTSVRESGEFSSQVSLPPRTSSSNSQAGLHLVSSKPSGLLLGKNKKRKKVIVKYNSQTVLVELPMDSMEQFMTALKESLNIKEEISVQVYYQKSDFKDFIDLIDMDQLKAKMPMIKVFTKAQRFWTFAINSDWVTKGFQDNQYVSLLVKEGDKIYNTEVMDKFRILADNMGFEAEMPYKIFSISNQTVLSVFDSYRLLLFGKQRQSPQLFSKDDWREMPDVELREAYLKWLEGYAAKFAQINDKTKGIPNVLPMIQGTSEEAVWQICQQGFGITAITDDGYYGRGVYFTSNLKYASRYAKESPKVPGYNVFLLSMVIPGNTFPVTEDPWDAEQKNKQGYHGQPCRVGYQSHFTLVDSPKKNSSPTKTPFTGANIADELVIFQVTQALPLFVFYLK